MAETAFPAASANAIPRADVVRRRLRRRYGWPVGAAPKTRAAPRLAAALARLDGVLAEDGELVDVEVTGDHSGVTAAGISLTGCRLEGARLVGAQLAGGRLLDCVLTACDLTGMILEDCVASRVEFRDCRLSSVQAGGGRFHDVAFIGCKLDDASFRMTTWERAEFESCDLAEADFYAATLPGTLFGSCDLTGAELSKSSLAGSRLQCTILERLKGADALRGVTITGDLIIPAALALFGSMGITVDDER